MPSLPSRKDPEPTALRLEQFLPYRLSRLSNTISAGIAATYTDRYHLSVTQWRVIAIVGRFPGMSASDVSASGALDKVAVSRAVNRLTSAGLLVRSVAADDRRRSVLQLSARGHRVYREIAPAAMRYERRLLAALDARERRALDRALDKLWHRARELHSSWPAQE